VAAWQDGKEGAVSLTFDDGSVNQFRVALPLMKDRGFPATFFVITGDIEGSARSGRYVGRPLEAILRESATTPTSKENFLERATALRYAPVDGAREAHKRAGELYDDQKVADAYSAIDRALADVRSGRMKAAPPATTSGEGGGPTLRWPELKRIAAQGYEFASHSVSHPYLSLLDDANLARELEDSRDEIRDQLGPAHTFSFECPFGIEDDRAVRAALARYPLVRNRMDDPNVDRIGRGDARDPTATSAEYVFWERGPLHDTPLSQVQQWIETAARMGGGAPGPRVWLVFVFHGVEGIGWEALPRSELEAIFDALAGRRDRLWVASFADAGKYIRERSHARVDTQVQKDRIVVRVSHDLDPSLYDVPLTLETTVPEEWSQVRIDPAAPGAPSAVIAASPDSARDGAAPGGPRHRRLVRYRLRPNGSPVVLLRAKGDAPP
jgi:peptidoglycan/xylan/chitin deacetylase (PgdA/CDA1 family)